MENNDLIRGVLGVTGPIGTNPHPLGPCAIKTSLIKEIYDKSVTLYYLLSDNNTKKCSHPGIPGPVGGEDFSWDINKAYLEGTIKTLKVCLENYKGEFYEKK